MITFVGSFSVVAAQTTSDPDVAAAAQEAYCKASAICGTAPKEFALMLDFVREMTNTIQTMGTEGDYLGQYVNPNRFEGNRFVPPQQQGIVKKFARNLSQKLKFGLASTAIFSNPVNLAGLKDMLGGTVLLAKNKVFLRDTKLIEKMEALLNAKKYELGAGGGWGVQVNSANLKIMQNIFTTYKNKGLLTGDSAIVDGVLYNNITSLLTQTLSSMKTFLYYNTTGQLDDISRGGDNGLKVVFDSAGMSNIKNEYACARGFIDVCNKNRMTFGKMRDSIVRITTGGIKSGFVQVIKTANQNLIQTFTKETKQDEAFKSREQDLLKSMYGSTKNPKGIFAGSIKKSLSAIGKDFTVLATDVANFWSTPKTLEERNKEIKLTLDKETPPPAFSTSKYNDADIIFENILKVYVEDVFVGQAIDNASVSAAELKDITPAFNIIGQQISVIKTDILGNKDKDGSLIKSLGEACELQCNMKKGCR